MHDRQLDVRLTMASGTNRLLRSAEVVSCHEYLDGLERELAAYRSAAQQLARAKDAGDSVAMWRAISRLATLADGGEL
jgi:hypothetical protein